MSLRFLASRLEPTYITRSACSKGRPRKSTALTSVKTVVLTPMPRASAATITAVNPGSRPSRRRAYFTSCQKLMLRTDDIPTPKVPSLLCLVHHERRHLRLSEVEAARRRPAGPGQAGHGGAIPHAVDGSRTDL